MIVWCKKQHTNFERYEELGLSIDSLPINARLINYDGFDTKGPFVQTALSYLGEIDKVAAPLKPISFKKNNKGETNKKLKPLIDALSADNSERVNLVNQIGFFNDVAKPRHYEGEYDIFAAHFKMNYEVNDEKTVTGVRPFSKHTFGDNRISHPEYYRYSFNNVRMPERIGLDISKVFGIDDDNVVKEYEFHFQAPEDYSKIKKWEDIEHIDKWIGEIPKSLDAG